MELTLSRSTSTSPVVTVTCDGTVSHTFDIQTLIPASQEGQQGPPQPIDDPVAYGTAIYQALFPPESLARRSLDAAPERILIVASDSLLDSVPWEYAHGPDGYLVLACHFVRGIPARKRIASPDLTNTPLHIVAVPSHPLDKDLSPLNIKEEWRRLREIFEKVHFTCVLERTYPPTVEQLRSLVVGQRNRVVHFMGHGGLREGKEEKQRKNDEGQQKKESKKFSTYLCFEKENGTPDEVTAKQLLQRIRGTAFLVSLNACVTAAPDNTSFTNVAATLVQQKIPYALGMRLSILDDDALAFSRTFYDELARGSSVEEALLQARLTLADTGKTHRRPWVVGVPVLYTSLSQPASGFAHHPGQAGIETHHPPIQDNALPPAQATFQGRIDALKWLGERLTGQTPSRIVTVLGSGGQGKTTLAHEAVERFAHAWPGGVWAISLERVPAYSTFVTDLAQFVDVATQDILAPKQVEDRLLAHLKRSERRTLLVLDNAETFLEAVKAQDTDALHIADLLLRLPATVSLFATSRDVLGWPSEEGFMLDGLRPEEGAWLFREYASGRRADIPMEEAKALSIKLDGHPFGLQLLGSAFNECDEPLALFLEKWEERLVNAKNIYRGSDHRHYKLDSCIETSVDYLDEPLYNLLSGLWIFHAPFVAETAVAIFDPNFKETEDHRSPVRDQLYALWQRSLLVRGHLTVREGTWVLYQVLPTMRPYIKQYIKQAYKAPVLQKRFGKAYYDVVQFIYAELNSGMSASALARLESEDIEQGTAWKVGKNKGYYLCYWGWIQHRLGNPLQGMRCLERALEIAQQQDQALELLIFNNMGLVYQATGKPKEALKLYEQALSLAQDMRNRLEESTTLNNMGLVYQVTGKPKEALKLYEQVLPLMQEVGDRAGEATVLNNMGLVYQATGKPKEALKLYEQSLLIRQEVGDRAGEATTLNNMASVSQATGKPKEALKLYEQALSLTQEVGDRTAEAATLNGMAAIYQATGKPKEALKLYEQVLPIRQEVGDRAGEATTLNNMAIVSQATGKPEEALKLYEQALSLTQEVGDRAREAATLNNIASVYQVTGKPKEALKLYEQVLPLMQEVGNRAGEAATLNNMASLYREAGKREKALKLYEQSLPIQQEVGDRSGEATTLNGMAIIYRMIGKPEEALKLYEQSLPIQQEVGDREGEAATLNNIAVIYSMTGKPEEALKLYEQVLPLAQEVGNRTGEASVLNGMGYLFQQMHDYKKAQTAFKQSLVLQREASHPAGEIAGLIGLALLLYQNLNQPEEAITCLEQALEVFNKTGLSYDSAGQTVDDVQRLLEAIRAGGGGGGAAQQTMTLEALQRIINNTVVVLKHMPENREEWREVIAKYLKNAKQQGNDWQIEVDFFTAVLALLDGQTPVFAEDHPYAGAIIAIQQGIEVGGVPQEQDGQNREDKVHMAASARIKEFREAISAFVNAEDLETKQQVVESQKELLLKPAFKPVIAAIFQQNIAQAEELGNQRVAEILKLYLTILEDCQTNSIAETFKRIRQAQETPLPFDPDLIPRSVAALRGTPQDRMALLPYLIEQQGKTSDEGLKALFTTIQLALYSPDRSRDSLLSLGQSLESISQHVWEVIVMNVTQQDDDERG